jgi:uncharacterized membrane protein
VLFGSFLVWSILSFLAAQARDRAAQTTYPAGMASGTVITVVVSSVVWAVFSFWAHAVLTGIRPI